MDVPGDDAHIEQERQTFDLFAETVAITRESLLARAEASRFEFFTFDRLHGIAAEEMTDGRVKWENDLDDCGGVYIFTRLIDPAVMKVGQASNLRTRIANAHLRYWNQSSTADLCGYYHSRGLPWPQSLIDDEMTLCVIPMPNSSKLERESLEKWLQAKLHPKMK